jgi:hypothetical protein
VQLLAVVVLSKADSESSEEVKESLIAIVLKQIVECFRSDNVTGYLMTGLMRSEVISREAFLAKGHDVKWLHTWFK